MPRRGRAGRPAVTRVTVLEAKFRSGACNGGDAVDLRPRPSRGGGSAKPTEGAFRSDTRGLRDVAAPVYRPPQSAPQCKPPTPHPAPQAPERSATDATDPPPARARPRPKTSIPPPGVPSTGVAILHPGWAVTRAWRRHHAPMTSLLSCHTPIRCAARALALAALAAGVLAPAADAAPITLSTEQRATPIAAWAGTVAWSSYDAAAGNYRPMVSRNGAEAQPVAVAPSAAPFDLDLGTNRNGSTYAVYSRCSTPGAQIPGRGTVAATGCDIYRLSLATGVEQPLHSISSPRFDERDPTIFRGEIAFIRTERHAGRTEDVLRIANTTSGARGTRALVRVPARRGGLSSPELSFGRVAYIRGDRGPTRAGELVVHVRTLHTGRDRAVYAARSGGANFANIAGLSITDDIKAFTWARTNLGSGTGNRIVRYDLATGRLSYALGSSRYVSTAWASHALGAAVMVDPSSTGTCSPNVNDQTSRCSVQLTGPLSFDARP